MKQYRDTFERTEKKYLLAAGQYRALREALREYAEPDQYGKSSIGSLYFDTPDHRLIRASLDKPAYKEKLRLRSYGVPHGDSAVFAEIKKKYRGVVYKRRVELTLTEGMAYLCGREGAPSPCQITREIDWMLRHYGGLLPSMHVSYDRTALAGIENPGLRITFDQNIRWRETELSLERGAWGNPLLDPGQRLMELKLADAMPLWLARLLDRLEIYPVSYSKYGNAYLRARSFSESPASQKEVVFCA